MQLEYGENGARRLAGLELSCEWVGKKIILRMLLVVFQSITENKLEVSGRGYCRVSVGHMNEERRDFQGRWQIGEGRGRELIPGRLTTVFVKR